MAEKKLVLIFVLLTIFVGGAIFFIWPHKVRRYWKATGWEPPLILAEHIRAWGLSWIVISIIAAYIIWSNK